MFDDINKPRRLNVLEDISVAQQNKLLDFIDSLERRIRELEESQQPEDEVERVTGSENLEFTSWPAMPAADSVVAANGLSYGKVVEIYHLSGGQQSWTDFNTNGKFPSHCTVIEASSDSTETADLSATYVVKLTGPVNVKPYGIGWGDLEVGDTIGYFPTDLEEVILSNVVVEGVACPWAGSSSKGLTLPIVPGTTSDYALVTLSADSTVQWEALSDCT